MTSSLPFINIIQCIIVINSCLLTFCGTQSQTIVCNNWNSLLFHECSRSSHELPHIVTVILGMTTMVHQHTMICVDHRDLWMIMIDYSSLMIKNMCEKASCFNCRLYLQNVGFSCYCLLFVCWAICCWLFKVGHLTY